MIELEHDSFDTHNYLDSLMSQKDDLFDQYYKEYEARFSLDGGTVNE